MQPPYTLVTFGGLRLVRADGTAVTGPGAQLRVLVVLAILASAGSRGAARERVMTLLWPESSEARARHALAQLLYMLKRALEPLDPLGGTAGARILVLDPAVIDADVRAFADTIALGDDAGAIARYEGEFLAGVFPSGAPASFEEWVDGERARFASDHRAALDREIARRRLLGDRPGTAALARSRQALDPLDVPSTLALMDALAEAGDAPGALETARRHGVLRHTDLDQPPEPSVTALAERIRRAATATAVDESRTRRTPVPVPAHAELPDEPPQAASPLAPQPAAPATDGPSPSPALARHTRSRRAVALVALLALAGGVAAVARVAGRDEPPVPAAPPRSIAVLPFQVIDADSTIRWFGDGVAEELLQALARVDSLRVASRGASFALRSNDLDTREVGRRLGVASVVEGTVRRDGPRMRLAVRLVGTADGYTLWSETYDREVADLFAVEEEVARRIAGALRIRLASSPATPHRATDAATLDLYLRGRWAWGNSSDDAGLQESERLLRRAIARDSMFAPAYVGLADAMFKRTAFHEVRPRTVMPLARAALARALALDPSLADAHASMGYLLTFHEWNWAEADAEFAHALALDPRHAKAQLWLAWLRSAEGRHEEALAAVRRAQEISPLDPLIATRVATMLYLAGDWDGSIAHCEQILRGEPKSWLARRQLGEALVQRGDAARGVDELRRAAANEPTAESRARLAYGLARAGDARAARALLDTLVREAAHSYVSPVETARVRVALGDPAGALADLARARDDAASLFAIVGVDPSFAPLRADPRFIALLPGRGRAP